MGIKDAFTIDPPTAKDYRNLIVIFQREFDITYADGYIKSAETIISSYDGKIFYPGDDIIVYPVLYLIRHALELSLKICIRHLRGHFERRCNLMTGLKTIYAQHRFTNVTNEHRLIPLYDDIIFLRTNFSIHHQSDRLIDLHDDLQFFDEIDPESTATRYAKPKNLDKHPLHERQRWVDPRELVSSARDIYMRIITECQREDLELCDAGFFRQCYIDRMKTMERAISSVVAWEREHLPEESPPEESPPGKEKFKCYPAVFDLRRLNRRKDEIAKSFGRDILRNAIVGYYVSRDREALTYKRLPEFDHIEECIRKVAEISLSSKEYELGRLRNLIAKLDGMNRQRPFPPC